MTATEPCVSPTTGVLSPDLRVNYAYGMVLGVDEFLQEQLHHLSKDYLHERALHGFGTVSGLAVSVAPTPDNNDYTVSVTMGVAIDQWGREIVIRCDQCARLGAWLGVQEQADPGTIAEHLGPEGQLTVYVVASYAECLDALVPLPGQPCSSSDQTMVPSRIRDAWDVELRWERPAMPRWDTDRRLARLISTVAIVAGLDPADSSEADITAAVLGLLDLADDGPAVLDPPANAWQLPAETAAAALDRIFTVWVTRVRPFLAPDLIEPEAASDPAILLAEITFVPTSPFDPAAPTLESCEDPVEDARPYLLATELIQELRWLGDSVAAPPAPEPVDPMQLVTLAVAGGRDQRTAIDVWFHLERPVHLPATITVDDEDGGSFEYLTSTADPSDFGSVWTLSAPDDGVQTRDGLQLKATFPMASVFVVDMSTTLLDFEDSEDVSFLDRTDANDVLAYGIVRGPDGEAPPAAEPKASKEFVTITTLINDRERLVLELWFHPQPREWEDNVRVRKFEDQVFDETNGQQLTVTALAPSPFSQNVWYMQLKHPYPGKNVPIYLRHIFPTYEAEVDAMGDGMSLLDWIHKADITFIGYDESRAEVIAFSRPEAPELRDDIFRAFEGGDVIRPERRAPRPDAPDFIRPVGPPVQPVEGPVTRPVAKKTAKKAPARKAPAKKAPAKKAPAKKQGGGNR